MDYIDFDAIKLGDLAVKIGDIKFAIASYSKAYNKLTEYQGDRMLPIEMAAGVGDKLNRVEAIQETGNIGKSILIFEKWKLSKSSYVKGMQCKKYLYLDKYKKRARKPVSREKQALFDKGNLFEKRFRNKQFPNGINVREVVVNFAYFNSYTRYLLDSTDSHILYETTIIEDEVLIMCDVLKKNKDGKIDVYEVKSSKLINEAILNGLAIQYYVCKKRFGNTLNSFNLVLRADDTKDEYSIKNLTTILEDKFDEVSNNIADFKKILLGNEPKISTGIQCKYPYECEFIDYCKKI